MCILLDVAHRMVLAKRQPINKLDHSEAPVIGPLVEQADAAGMQATVNFTLDNASVGAWGSEG